MTRSRWDAYIGGEWQPAASGERFAVTEPATGQTLAEVAACGAPEINAAVAAAREAFEDVWRPMPPQQRARMLREVAARIRSHAPELAQLETREVGKPIRDAMNFDVTVSHVTFDFYAGQLDALEGRILQQGPIEAHVTYEPFGVVGAILPFNWPPVHFGNKVAPALLAGNTVVVKPGEQAPLTALRLTEIANEVLPPGVLNAVPGLAAGAALVAHPDVSRLTFTGSSDTGRRILTAAADNLVPATMELGGKNALVVFEDADLDVALSSALEGMYFNQGEACTSTARLLIHESIYERFAERFAAASRSLVVGDGLEADTAIGAMVDSRQRDRVRGYVESALEEGARIAAEGSLPTDPRLKDGYWVAPTVLVDVTPDMRVAREEIFGPVACLMRFRDEAEAVEIANATPYGLTAAVFSSDHERAARVARRLEAGMVFVNNYFRGSLMGSPFGGIKHSGFGRESARESLHEFVQAKNTRFPSGAQPIPVWAPVLEASK